MLVLRKKKFSGYSESIPEGIEYISSQVGEGTTKYLLDPIGDGLEAVENLPIVKTVKPKKLNRFKRLARSTSKFIKTVVLDKNKKKPTKKSKK